MGIADRIILTLYTFLMAVVSVLAVLCSLGVFSPFVQIIFLCKGFFYAQILCFYRRKQDEQGIEQDLRPKRY